MTLNVVSGLKTGGQITGFPPRAFNITASDTTEYDGGIAVFANGAGDVTVEPVSGTGTLAPSGYSDTTVTFTLAAGQLVPVTVKRVLATGTTATGLIAVY